jgi:hypothetical protein
MNQRINRWSAKGVIYCIARVQDSAVRVAYDECCNEGRVDMSYSPQRDRPLIKFILGMEKQVEHVLNSYRFPEPSGTSKPTLNRLLSIFKRIDSNKEKAPTEVVYTQETCVEFHHFLVATLLSYSDALQQLCSSVGQNQDSEEMIRQAEKVRLLSNLIWKISDTKVLEIHMQAISNSINRPSVASLTSYTKFVGGEVIAEENNDGEGDLPPPGSQGMGSQCHQWIRLQASHFEALHIVDSYCRGRNLPKPPTLVDISLIAVQAPPLEVENWEETLEKLTTLSPLTFDLEAAKKFVSELKAEKGKKYSSSKPHIGVPHCEACLGVLIKVVHDFLKNGNLEQDSDDLIKLVQV